MRFHIVGHKMDLCQWGLLLFSQPHCSCILFLFKPPQEALQQEAIRLVQVLPLSRDKPTVLCLCWGSPEQPPPPKKKFPWSRTKKQDTR